MESVNESWTALRKLHVHDSVVSRTSLMQKLHWAKMLPRTSVSDHLQYLQGMVVELEVKGVFFPELQKAFIVLSSLPERFDNLVTSLESLPQWKLTLNSYLTGSLLEEELKQAGNWAAKGRPTTVSPATGTAGASGLEEVAPGIHVVKRCYCCGLATSNRIKARTKHVGLRYHNVKDAIKKGLIELQYCPQSWW